MNKTQETNASVDEFIDSIEQAPKREDCRAIAKLMQSATGQKPKMWGTHIIGFGKHHYTYANGKPGEICNVGFAPRSRSFALYLSNFPGREKLLNRLGKHRFSGGCLHVVKLADIDEKVLADIVQKAYVKGNSSAA